MKSELKLGIVLLLVPFLVLGIPLARLIPWEEDTTIEEEDDGMVGVSTTISPSPLTIVLIYAFLGSILIAFFFGTFLTKMEFKTKAFPGIIWILGTPMLFLFYLCSLLFDRLPCPQCHNLEVPMMLSLGAFLLSYLLLYFVLFVELMMKLLKGRAPIPKLKVTLEKGG